MVDTNMPTTSDLANSQLSMKASDNVISSKINHTYCNKNDDNNYPFIIYHQNIQGLKGKTNEFMLSLFADKPNLICLSEHHLKQILLKFLPIN
jgi:hypothetical protein